MYEKSQCTPAKNKKWCGGREGWPPGGGCKGPAPPCIRKVVFRELKVHNFNFQALYHVFKSTLSENHLKVL